MSERGASAAISRWSRRSAIIWTTGCREAASHREAISFVTDRPGHDFRYAIDPDKIEREIGWRSEQSFDAGLKRTIEWYIANEAWWREIRSTRYDGERLGLVNKDHVCARSPHSRLEWLSGGPGRGTRDV